MNGRRPRNVESWLSAGLPTSVASRNYVPAPLHNKQRSFMALPHLEALYGGAAGGGKTEALLADALRFIESPTYSALILRRTFPALMLRGSIMQRALEWIGRDRWNERDKVFRFPSGATIQFGYCDSANDLERYKSAQFHRIYIDELTEWPEQWYAFLFSRIRRIKGDSVPLAMRAATNPDGLGSEWVRKRFEIPEGAIVTNLISDDSRAFMPATAEDNPSLDLESYEASLSKLGPIKYQQLRFGKWLRDGEGLVYGHFDDKRNIVALLPAGNIRRILSIDFGFTDATAFAILLWEEFSRQVIVERCWKEVGLTPSDVAERVESLSKDYTFQRIIGDTGGLGKGYAEEMRARWHIPIEAAEKQNKRGYIDLLNGALSRAELVIRMPECEALRDEWLVLPWEEGRQRESEGFDNHCSDGVLYGWRAATAYAERDAPKAKSSEEALEDERDRRREALRRGREGEGWDKYAGSNGGIATGGWEERHGRRR